MSNNSDKKRKYSPEAIEVANFITNNAVSIAKQPFDKNQPRREKEPEPQAPLSSEPDKTVKEIFDDIKSIIDEYK